MNGSVKMTSGLVSNPNSERLGVAAEEISGRLTDYLACHLDADTIELIEMRLLSGGAIQQNWMVVARLVRGDHLEDVCWVLRTNAESAVSVSMDRAQEFAVLKAVYDRGGKVPRPIVLCEDPGVIGSSFFIMEMVKGTASPHQLCSKALLEEHRQGLVWELGASLARIHEIEPEPSLISVFGNIPEDPSLFTVNNCRDYLAGLPEAFPVLSWAIRWAERNAPKSDRLCLLHRDYRTGNYMVEEGRLAAILDWEFAGWGDPREDIGWFTARCWRFSRPDRTAGGVGQLEDFLAGYRSVRDLKLDDEELRFWQVVATTRWAVIALQQAQRHSSGQESSLELALTGRILPALELDILSLTEPRT